LTQHQLSPLHPRLVCCTRSRLSTPSLCQTARRSGLRFDPAWMWTLPMTPGGLVANGSQPVHMGCKETGLARGAMIMSGYLGPKPQNGWCAAANDWRPALRSQRWPLHPPASSINLSGRKGRAKRGTCSDRNCGHTYARDFICQSVLKQPTPIIAPILSVCSFEPFRLRIVIDICDNRQTAHSSA